jgi:transcriptional regulator with XRE-family HTH domain
MAVALAYARHYLPMAPTDSESDRLRELMRRAGVGQREMAERLGMTQATLNRKLTGKSAWSIPEYKSALSLLGATEEDMSGKPDAKVAGGIVGLALDAGTRKRLEDAARRYGLVDGDGKPNLEAMVRVFVAKGLATHEAEFSE